MRKKIFSFSILIIVIYNILVFLLYLFESSVEASNIHTIADAYWYSVVTLTTVGYGDFYPITFWGRLVGLFFVIGSLGILGILITDLSLKISDYLAKKKEGYFGTDMEKHCVIIGWNSFSQGIVNEIVKANKKVAIITDQKNDIETIRSMYSKENCFVLLSDLKNHKNFEKVNIQESDRVYLGFDNDTNTLVYTINLKKVYKELNCVVALDNIELKSSFNFLGVKYVISKNEIASRFVASYIFEPHVAILAEDLLSTSIAEGDLDIHQEELKVNSSLIGMSYLEVFTKFKKEYNVVLIGLARNKKVYKNPKDMQFEVNDFIIFISDYLAKEKVILLMNNDNAI